MEERKAERNEELKRELAQQEVTLAVYVAPGGDSGEGRQAKLFGVLVLGCIDAEFCNQIRICWGIYANTYLLGYL